LASWHADHHEGLVIEEKGYEAQSLSAAQSHKKKGIGTQRTSKHQKTLQLPLVM
jgi:hypothetical protein